MRVKFCEIQILNGILSHVVPPFLGSLTQTENRNLHKLILVSGTQGKEGKTENSEKKREQIEAATPWENHSQIKTALQMCLLGCSKLNNELFFWR